MHVTSVQVLYFCFMSYRAHFIQNPLLRFCRGFDTVELFNVYAIPQKLCVCKVFEPDLVTECQLDWTKICVCIHVCDRENCVRESCKPVPFFSPVHKLSPFLVSTILIIILKEYKGYPNIKQKNMLHCCLGKYIIMSSTHPSFKSSLKYIPK